MDGFLSFLLFDCGNERDNNSKQYCSWLDFTVNQLRENLVGISVEFPWPKPTVEYKSTWFGRMCHSMQENEFQTKTKIKTRLPLWMGQCVLRTNNVTYPTAAIVQMSIGCNTICYKIINDYMLKHNVCAWDFDSFSAEIRIGFWRFISTALCTFHMPPHSSFRSPSRGREWMSILKLIDFDR